MPRAPSERRCLARERHLLEPCIALAPVDISLGVHLARPGACVPVNQHDLCRLENESFLPHPIQQGLPVPTQILGGGLQGIPVLPHRL